ncbi:ester cyclase [Marinithermus hydrothermalis]|uniref:ester cyclase n=1 Tax=Marinithermus hydrothermalis TaxID=186192 RepID=UPI00145D0FEA|nr:ester cyclase [Marinithermus hydrothermalis]
MRSIARKEVVRVRPEAPIAEACRLMEENNIGCVVVSDNGKPLGLVTDRDLTLRVLRQGMDPKKTKVEQVMTREVLTLNEDMGLLEALEAVRGKPIRRFLVVNDKGELSGIFTLDDVMYLIGREMADVASIMELEAPPERPASLEGRNQAAARRIIEEGLNKGNLAALDEVIAEQLVDHDLPPGLPQGREGVKQLFTQMRRAFPDLRATIEDAIAAGDRVVLHQTLQGTHKGELFGRPPTGKRIAFREMHVIRFENGKAVEHWGITDLPERLGTAGDPAQAERNQAVVRRYFEEVWNQGRFDGLREIVTADYVNHDPAVPDAGRGPESVRALVEYYQKAFPDTRFTIEEMHAVGDRVVTRWKAQGTHKGELMGIPPTGKKVVVTGLTIDRLEGGRVKEGWTHWDTLGMLQQLGVLSSPEAAGRNKAALRRLYEALDRREFRVMDEILAKNCVAHIPGFPDPMDCATFKQFIRGLYNAFGNYEHVIEDLFAADDRVVARLILRGTHEGEFKGIAPTHKSFAINSTVIARFADGRLVEYWGSPDLLGLMQQLGVIEG